MTILGIGVDLVHIPRIASLLGRRNPERFAAKILSTQEYNQWVSLGASEPFARLRFLAVRYCRSVNSIYRGCLSMHTRLDGMSKKRYIKLCTLVFAQHGRKLHIMG